MKENSRMRFHPMALFFWILFIAGPIGILMYMTPMNKPASSTTWW